MRKDQPKYAVKFMARVGEEHAEDAAAALQESVASRLMESGFRELLVVSRRLEIAEPRILRRLLERVPAESGYARHIRDLHETLVMGGPKSHAHSMLHYRDKVAYPEEYALIKEIVETESHWTTIPIRQFDCFAIYATELDMRADTLGRRSLREGRPYSGDLVAGELDGLLVSPLRGTHHTLLYRSRLSHAAISRAYGAQTQVSAFLHRKEARSWIHERLLPALTAKGGCLGGLVLRSRNMGFVAGRGTVPRGLREHSGESPKLSRESPANSTVLCECVTLWETEADMDAGARRITESLPGTLGSNLAGDFVRGIAHTEYGEFVMRI